MDRDESLSKYEEYLKRRFPDRRTSKDYISDLHQFVMSCTKPWREVNMHDIDEFVDQQRQSGLKPATAKRRAAALKTFFNFLAEETGDLNWLNPVRMKRHGGKQGFRLPRDLSNEAVERVWFHISNLRDRAWFALMLRAGLRVGEVASLKLEDIIAPPGESQPARYEPLFSILDGVRLDNEKRYWIERREVKGNNSDIKEEVGNMSTGVEILLPVSHNTLTNAEEYIQ
jgi:site-specific recombinase XerC